MYIWRFIKLKSIYSYFSLFIYFKDFNGIQKTIVIEKDTVVGVSKEIVDKPNQSTIDKIANPEVMEIVKKVASSAMDQSEVFGILRLN